MLHCAATDALYVAIEVQINWKKHSKSYTKSTVRHRQSVIEGIFLVVLIGSN